MEVRREEPIEGMPWYLAHYPNVMGEQQPFKETRPGFNEPAIDEDLEVWKVVTGLRDRVKELQDHIIRVGGFDNPGLNEKGRAQAADGLIAHHLATASDPPAPEPPAPTSPRKPSRQRPSRAKGKPSAKASAPPPAA